jgi:hypothetical protein
VAGPDFNQPVGVKDNSGRFSIRLNSNDATVIVGVEENSGEIVLRDGNGQTTIRLDAGQGDIHLLGADCAEEFDVDEPRELVPGTVMAIGNEGKLRRCAEAYDKRVAGVISGAGGYRSGIILDKRPTHDERMPLALSGKVYCKVDARYASIEVGDLLTTSPTLGHAMKAADPLKAFGAVIGKALRPLKSGQQLIPVLVALQ